MYIKIFVSLESAVLCQLFYSATVGSESTNYLQIVSKMDTSFFGYFIQALLVVLFKCSSQSLCIYGGVADVLPVNSADGRSSDYQPRVGTNVFERPATIGVG